MKGFTHRFIPCKVKELYITLHEIHIFLFNKVFTNLFMGFSKQKYDTVLSTRVNSNKNETAT